MEYRLNSVNTLKFDFLNKSHEQNQFKLSPMFGKKIEKINDNDYKLLLSFSLHDKEDAIAPYDIDLEIVGIFSLKADSENEIDEFLNKNAVAIVFPYLRSILSTALSSMMIQPLILPIVDACQLFVNN